MCHVGDVEMSYSEGGIHGRGYGDRGRSGEVCISIARLRCGWADGVSQETVAPTISAVPAIAPALSGGDQLLPTNG
jgi:hypothetical protein